MVLYISEIGDKFIYYGYKDWIEGKSNGTGLKDDVATTEGYKNKKDDAEFVIPNSYIAGIFKDRDEFLSSIKRFDIKSLIVMGFGPLSFYIKNGESFDGIKDNEIDIDFIKVLREKLIYTDPTYTTITIEKELESFIDIAPKEWVFNNKRYWDLKIDKPALITGSKLVYFPNLNKIDDKHLYLCTNIKENDELGKQIETSNYTILLTEEIPEVTNLIDTLDTSLNQPIVIKHDNLYNKQVARILMYGELKINKYLGAIEIKTRTGVVLAILFSPPGLMMILRDDIQIALNGYQKGKRVDITDKLYKDNKLLPTIDNKFTMDVNIGKLSVKLHSAIDFLDRNHFKRLEKNVKSVALHYMQRGKCIKHYTVIELKSGDKAITYAPFNNLLFDD